jgi:acetyl-CoA carboxylase carboxyl transferase subunit alpha
MAVEVLDFEAPLAAIQKQIESLTGYPEEAGKGQEISRLKEKLDRTRQEIFSRLTPWQKVQVARHPHRPYMLDLVHYLFRDFVEIHGDRRFADDPAIVTGFAWFQERPVVLVGHQKGRDTKQKIFRNFGMPKPEGYRKAIRVMRIAEKFGRPIFTFIDTPGAYPGIDAEERGQAEAIAYNIREMARLSVPIVVTVMGEGGSGGALAIGVGDEVLMLEHAIYSVISPEGCAAILWKDAGQKERAAEALKLTAPDLLRLQVIDEIIPEPPGGAHADPPQAARALGDALDAAIRSLEKLSPEALRRLRAEKFRRMGKFAER